MAGAPVVLVLCLATILGCAYAKPAYPDASTALATRPELSMLYAAGQSVGLVGDAVFNGKGNWEATMFVPTNAAFGRMLARKQMTFADWLKNKDEVKATLLHHIVSGYQIKSPAEWLYDTQILATLQTRVNGRSKLTVIKTGNVLALQGDLTRAPFTAKMKPISAGLRVSLIEIDEVLLADVVSPKVLPLPNINFPNLADAISKIPGLETFWRMVKADAKLLAILSDPNFKGTVWAPNEKGLSVALKALQTSPEAFLADSEYMSKVLPYHVVPDVTTNTLDFNIVSKKNRVLTTLLDGHTIHIELYNKHVVPAGDLSKGKTVFDLPRSLYIMPPGRGTLDVVAGKGALHVIDGWLLPKV